MAKRGMRLLVAVCFLVSISTVAKAQQTANNASTVVPRLIKFSATLLDERGSAMKGPVGVTFALYTAQSGGAALWIETQNVEPDSSGNYTVLLGAASARGVPQELFASGEARWLGIQVENQAEQPRVLLVSVPYALEAGDAQTLGGLPPSAFAPANFNAPANASPSSVSGVLLATPSGQPEAATNATNTSALAGGGTTNFIPLWTNSTTLGNSILFQSTTSNVNVNGSLTMPALKAATSSAGANSQPLDLLGSAFSSSTHTAVSQHFRWQAEPVGNNTATPSGKLNLLYAAGTAAPAETGFSISNRGLITFASGQTLPVVSGNETVTGNETVNGSVSAGGQLISTVANGTAPLKVTSTTLVLNLNASLLGGMPASSFATRGANSFSGFQSIAGNGLSMYIGDVACPAGTVGIQAQVFSFGCSNFAMLLDTRGDTIINRPKDGKISFREGNGSDQLVIQPGGSLNITPGPGGLDALIVLGSAGESGVQASGGSAVLGGGGTGGVGIEAFGGSNSDGTLARAGEFHGDVEITGCVSATGTIIGGSCQSDIRFKKNIHSFPSVIDKVAQLRPVSYDWRTEEFPQRRFPSDSAMGLIAQEVEKVFPEMVSTDEAGYKRVNYGELPYLMLQAIRELKAENDELRERIQQLEKASSTP